VRGQPTASRFCARVLTALCAVAASAAAVAGAAAGPAGASGILPPSKPAADVSPQVVPACTTPSVDDTNALCVDSVLHNINYARSLEGLGPLVLPNGYASDSVPVQQLIIADEERGDRGLSQFSGLVASLNAAALTAAQSNSDPAPPIGFSYTSAGSNFAQDYTPLGADFAWMYNDGYGGTNLDCTSPGGLSCWGHRDTILGNWADTGSTAGVMGDADTAAGQYTQIFANDNNMSESLTDTIDPSTLPTPSTAATPDVVQVLPASSPNTAAGTPVTIEGNYFGSTPTVSFGGVAATNVHVNWDGELTADAPADPSGTATDQVVVTVTTGAGTSSSTGAAQVNEFTYVPSSAPSVTSVSPTSGTQVPSPSCSLTITGSHFYDGGVTPIVDFGTVASVGSMSYSSSQITTTIPPAVNPGTVHVTVTTPAGTSTVSVSDQYTYSAAAGSSPCITSGNAATFNAGSAGLFHVTTSGVPTVTSITDAAFSGCTPSALPADIKLVYAGGATAALQGTPRPGDGGYYTVCLQASNGTAPSATQEFMLTVNAPSPPPPPPPPPPSHGYWLVGSDGGIFSFGAAAFHGSTGAMHLQRPVVGISPTADRGGYWLVASDGGTFAFGDAGYYGSIPGVGLNPAGSGLPNSLRAPIVGMVPSADGGGYFMVASDGGVFAFGDATFAGSCPGIGGCSGSAVAVVPDTTGHGYWVVTSTGGVYPFGDATYHGAPGPQSSAITSAVATADGQGYWILDAAGQVFAYGDAPPVGGLPPGAAGGANPAATIFATSDGGGYWIATALGQVTPFGDAPNDGDVSGLHLNGEIIAASGS
jgi:IPT/TIG domain